MENAPNIVSLEQLELSLPLTLINPSDLQTDDPNATIFKDVPGVEPVGGEPVGVEPVSVQPEPSSTELIVSNLLIQLIEEKLNINISINLTTDEVYLLKLTMANSPSSLNNIENCIISIISDNTIDASDIPKFLVLFKDFQDLIIKSITNNVQFSGEQLVNISANIIKFIIPIILKKNNVNSDNLVSILNTLIDSATTLLLFIPQVKNGKCGLFCF
jgi:hypothetical protein